VTSWPSVKADLRNAGANWADDPDHHVKAIEQARQD
jgi:hypothetical protein